MIHGKPTTLITTYLEMTSHDDFIPAYVENAQIRIEKLPQIDVEFYLSMYRGVGEQLAWRDRLLMPREELSTALSKAHVYILYFKDVPAGYVELDEQGSSIEIAYFGLLPQYQGLGLGKHLLSYGIATAWQIKPERIYVHTCNLDGEHAMSNYLKRGFKVYETREEPMPERYL